jgi:hypothetical protein
MEFTPLHIDDWLTECLRILRPGGFLKFRMPAQLSLVPWIDSPAGLSVDVRDLCDAVEGPDAAERACSRECPALRAPISLEREGDQVVGTVVKPSHEPRL